MGKNNVIILAGPTATGKSSFAIELAQQFGGVIVNFDSLLFYNELNIGAAKPTKEELRKVPHYLVNCTSISTPLNASQYSRMAIPIIQNQMQKGETIFLVGGSGFYLKALLNGMYNSPTSPPEVLQKSEEMYQRDGIIPFLEILKEHDQKSFSKLHENDHYRIRRAVEHWWSTGTAFSKVQEDHQVENFAQAKNLGWNLHFCYLNIPKEQHLPIINARTKNMINAGLIDEVKNLYLQGFSGEEKPLQSIGYKETQLFLKGEIENIQALEEQINISTRQLAKSQRTWFNQIQEKEEFNPLTQKDQLWTSIQVFLKTGP